MRCGWSELTTYLYVIKLNSMKPNYTIRQTFTPNRSVNIVVQDNYSSINEVAFYCNYGNEIKDTLLSRNTVAVFKIKWKSKVGD